MKTRVVVVDDSALVRSLLAEIINQQADMQCVGAASDPHVAREMIRNLDPDVITLDVEMPVVMVSTLTEHGADVTMRALELGAVDFVAKPRIGVADGMRQLADDITDKIRTAKRARIRRAAVAGTSEPPPAIGRLSTESQLGRGVAQPRLTRYQRSLRSAGSTARRRMSSGQPMSLSVRWSSWAIARSSASSRRRCCQAETRASVSSSTRRQTGRETQIT